MLNPIEKFKVTILRMNTDLNHRYEPRALLLQMVPYYRQSNSAPRGTVFVPFFLSAGKGDHPYITMLRNSIVWEGADMP